MLWRQNEERPGGRYDVLGPILSALPTTPAPATNQLTDRRTEDTSGIYTSNNQDNKTIRLFSKKIYICALKLESIKPSSNFYLQ